MGSHTKRRKAYYIPPKKKKNLLPQRNLGFACTRKEVTGHLLFAPSNLRPSLTGIIDTEIFSFATVLLALCSEVGSHRVVIARSEDDTEDLLSCPQGDRLQEEGSHSVSWLGLVSNAECLRANLPRALPAPTQTFSIVGGGRWTLIFSSLPTNIEAMIWQALARSKKVSLRVRR